MNTGTWQAIAQSRGSARTELTHRVEIAHRLCRPNVDGFRPVRSRDASTRDSKCFVSVSMAPAGRDAACEDPHPDGGVRPSTTRYCPGGCVQMTRRLAGESRGAATARRITSM